MGILATLQDALRAAQSGKSEKEVVDNLKEASPEFAALAQVAVKRGGIPFLIFFLIYLLTNCSGKIDQKLDWNRLIDQAHQYLVVGSSSEQERQEASRSRTEQKQEPSRQQRRHKERQSKKPSQQREPPSEPRPPKPRPSR